MARFNDKTLKIMLALGIFCILAGAFLLICLVTDSFNGVELVTPLTILISGAVFLYVALAIKKNFWFTFLGISLLLNSFLVLICETGTIPWTLTQIWPVIVIICGICFIAASLIFNRKLPISVWVPSFVLMFLGVLFLLFSTDIITIPFRQIAAKWWPAIMILIGVGLIVLYWYLKSFNGKVQTVLFDDNDEEK